MSRKKPYITVQMAQNKDESNVFVLDNIEESFVKEFIPTQVELDNGGTIFTLYLVNHHLVADVFNLNDYSEYIDIYLFGVKQFNSYYSVASDGINITIIFNRSITDIPLNVITTDFIIKGNIAEITQ